MTIIILLASVSLFALVVASRPILPESDFAPTSSTLQTAVQAVFRIHSGENDLQFDPAHFQSPIPKQQIEYHAELDADSVAAIASFEISPGVKPSFEVPLDKPVGGQDAFDASDEFDDVRADHAASEPATPEPVVDRHQAATTDETPRAGLVVLVFSCVAAFLALVCVALTLYIVKSLRSQMLASRRAWDLLPRFWRYPRCSVPQENITSMIATAKEHSLDGGCLLLHTEAGQQRLLDAEGSAERHEDKPLHFDAISDMETEWDDVDEKYQDALDTTPLPPTYDLPLLEEEYLSYSSHFGNPPFLSSESYPQDQPRTDHSTLMMHEICTDRPDWSVRAIDSPALGLSSREGGVDYPQPLIHPRRRAYRSTVPEFDIALAMQLRPGLGIGADSAWMVRFLMAIFGWFTVALTGHSQ